MPGCSEGTVAWPESRCCRLRSRSLETLLPLPPKMSDKDCARDVAGTSIATSTDAARTKQRIKQRQGRFSIFCRIRLTTQLVIASRLHQPWRSVAQQSE